MNSFGLNPDIIENLESFFSKKSEIKSVKIFGSRVLNNYQPYSDIDLALFGNIDRRMLENILSELDELPYPYTFDVIDYNSIKDPDLKEHIDKFGIVLFNKTFVK